MPSIPLPTISRSPEMASSPSSQPSTPPSPSSLTPLTPHAHSVLSHLTRSKLQRAAAGRMSGGRGAPSLRQLVLWTNALVAPGIGGGDVGEGSSGWYDDAEGDGGDATAQDGYGNYVGDDVARKQAEQEWFENLMEEMVDFEDDDDEQDDGPAPASTALPASPLSVPVVVPEDERYVNIRYRHRGRAAAEADSGFLEQSSSSAKDPSPLDPSVSADDPAATSPPSSILEIAAPVPIYPSSILSRAISPPPPANAFSALTAQLKRPEDIPLPISSSPSPERRVIVRDLDGGADQDGAAEGPVVASWSSLLECEELSLADTHPSIPALASVAEETETTLAGSSSSVVQPASWSSAEMPPLTPDCSPPGVGFVGPSSVDDDDAAYHDDLCGWHRLLGSRRRGLRRPSVLRMGDVVSGKSVPADSLGSWLLGSAPFASEDSLVSPPGLETMELGPVDDFALADRLNLILPATSTSNKGILRSFEPKRSIGLVQLAETPPISTGFYVPPAPPLPPVLPSVVAPRRPWLVPSSYKATEDYRRAALPAPHSLSSADRDDDPRSRATSPRRWSGIVRTWFDCVDLGVCSETSLAPFGTLEAPGAAEATECGGEDHHEGCASRGDRRVQEALSIVMKRPCAWRTDKDRESSPSRLRALDLLG